jgi:putative hemolysin
MLQKFKKEKASFAIAVDANGANCGIVTMDDMLRVVFGRSVDEYPTEGVAPEKRIKAFSPVEFILPGDMRLDDVNEILDLDLESDDYDTLGGWLLEQFDALPQAGEMIKRNSVIYKVEDQAQRRIQSVKIKLPFPLTAERSAQLTGVR